MDCQHLANEIFVAQEGKWKWCFLSFFFIFLAMTVENQSSMEMTDEREEGRKKENYTPLTYQSIPIIQ